MTENEYTNEQLIDFMYDVMDWRDVVDQPMIYAVIEELKEIQQYRAIGTVEEIKEELSVADIQADKLNAYKRLGNIDEFKALKEKSVAKKPNQVSKAMDKDKFVGLIGRCPNCGGIVAEDNLVCEDCFQVLDWSE